jgi:hypothetical protein
VKRKNPKINPNQWTEDELEWLGGRVPFRMPANPSGIKRIPTLFTFTPRQVLLSNRTMKNGTQNSEQKQKLLLNQSIALYLERSGFSKTLKKFLSEAKIEVGHFPFIRLDTVFDKVYIFLLYVEYCIIVMLLLEMFFHCFSARNVVFVVCRSISIEFRICLDWLSWAYILIYTSVKLLGRAYGNSLWRVHKLLSAYFRKISEIAHVNSL